MTKWRTATDTCEPDNASDGSTPPELLDTFAEIFPEFDPHELLCEFRKLGHEHHRRLKLLFH